MYSERNSSAYSFPFGTWFGVEVRVNILFLLIVPILWFRLEDFAITVAFSLVLLISVLLHEFGHVFGARFTGGEANEVNITPFGGLAMCMPGPGFAGQFWTVAGGPLVNAALCAVALYPATMEVTLGQCLHPLQFPHLELGGGLAAIGPELAVLLFKANWLLLLVNLLPVHPLDGGRLLYPILGTRWDRIDAQTIYLRIGWICGILISIFGLAFDNSWVMALGTVVLVLNLFESFRMQTAEQPDESFMGYDFSEGYTSLERFDDDDETEEHREPGMIARWRNQREESRRQREEELERELARELDRLLEKLHANGEDSLSPSEKRQLKEISARFRNRDRGA